MLGQELTYEIDQKVNKKGTEIQATYTKFQLTDVLDTKVTFKSAMLLKNGVEMKDAKTIAYDEATRTVSFVGDATFLSGMEMDNQVQL